MVAYSFKAQFIAPIMSGEKAQTVRALRKRHARAGEAVQLYTAMRTKYCKKLVDPDPVVFAVEPVWIWVSETCPSGIAAVSIDGARLSEDEIVEFAINDGFGDGIGCPRAKMGKFWLENHGPGDFHGVLIQWRPHR